MTEKDQQRVATEPARPQAGTEPARTYVPDFLIELFRNPLDPGYADAAARRAQVGPATGWRQGARRAVAAVTLVAVGFLLAVAYRQTMADEPSRSKARAGLVAQIKERESDVGRLQTRADVLRGEVARQRDAALTDTDAARLRDLESVAGLARVRGDGVVVRVADGPGAVDAVTGKGTNLGRVYDGDLQDIVNALWGAGAEGISINGQRLTATSTIRGAGGAILVDFRPVTGPYEVSAIGPAEMEGRFQNSAAARLLRSVAADHGMTFQVRRAKGLILPAAAEPQLRYARPATTPTLAPSNSRAPTTLPPSGADESPSPTGGPR